MQRTVWTIAAGMAGAVLVLAGCSKDQPAHHPDAQDIAVMEGGGQGRMALKSKLAPKIIQAVENIERITGEGRKIVDQVSHLTGSGVKTGLYIEPRNAQWEYKVITPPLDKQEEELNKLGQDGWQLVTRSDIPDAPPAAPKTALYLRRLKQADAPEPSP